MTRIGTLLAGMSRVGLRLSPGALAGQRAGRDAPSLHAGRARP